MPDPTKSTISATQASALFNVSPYYTRWMLYRHFHDGIEIDSPEDARMSWGKRLQPLVLAQAAEDLRLEVIPNHGDTYQRRGLLGCTRDATIICPDRGPGALETKCVFDYRAWMVEWGGGRFVPRHHEIQLQQQMYVGTGELDGTSPIAPYEWGILAVWLAGEMKYFERKPLVDLWAKLENTALAFFSDVNGGHEPDPFGAPIEIPWLAQLFPCERGKILDLSEDHALAETAIQYRDAKEQEAAGKRTADPLRAKLLAAAKDAEELILPDGVRVNIRPHGAGKRVRVYQADTQLLADDFLMGG